MKQFNATVNAYIYKVEEIVEVEEQELDNFCENSLENYEGYLIPEMFNGKILI